ncbi:MAG TPA: NAD(P)-dependent oxidoreductase [Dehalococcoidia bacterium]|jgi:3-hydroxyisobutyrate dehydrogenase|nr:MAG: 3-hydroxyisobutyrate dehydrogenase [Dehalococcoidia bacterium]HAC20027.1 3-hydroxyisobutyrate dehydrogenase [Dehalococcoidia bacterium]HHZ62769.1 NAD(P)-dependent oxidoreductase [Dehalococcoidia bacterium]HIA17795.1 NAD(P)-dependent oxidoreductase [Dehalococcoidia bacterium]HIM90153.1 NAD(P)-dependent oxidoreductase [Dehalococcoidia bacterium]
METIGFIGLGNLGTAIAQNIQNAGYPMVVYDIREGATKPLLKEGSRLAGAPDEVASLSDVTFTSLPGPREVEDVTLGLHGVVNGIKEGGIYVDLSTSRPSLIRRIGEIFEEKSVKVLDAPVLTSPATAADRQVVVMPSGDREVYQKLRPLFDSFADTVVYQGPLGMGSTCKLVNNMITLAVRQVVAEGLTLGVKAGLDLDSLMEAGNRMVLGHQEEGLRKTVFRGQFDPPSFRQALARKDIGLANELGRELNVPMPVANLVEQISIQIGNRGWGDMDTHVIYRLQEEMAGVEIRS